MIDEDPVDDAQLWAHGGGDQATNVTVFAQRGAIFAGHEQSVGGCELALNAALEAAFGAIDLVVGLRDMAQRVNDEGVAILNKISRLHLGLQWLVR